MFDFHIVSKSTHSSTVGQPAVTLPSPVYLWYTFCALDECDSGAVHEESEVDLVDSEVGVDSGAEGHVEAGVDSGVEVAFWEESDTGVEVALCVEVRVRL
jgi:hypothetical protein